MKLLVYSHAVAEQPPPQDLLHQLLFQFLEKIDFVDVIIIHLQEVVKSIGTSKNVQEYINFFTEIFPSMKLEKQHVVSGLLTLVFIQPQLKISRVHCYGEALGVGCKGFINTRLDFKRKTYQVVNVHLMHDDDQLKKRKEQFNYIEEKLVKESDGVIIAGNLNFRFNRKIEKEDPSIQTFHPADFIYKNYMKDDQINWLVPYRYEEASVTFKPTYKYVIKQEYLTAERVPCWTDRIIYKGNMKVLQYSSLQDAVFSDHRPVIGLIQLNPPKTSDNDSEADDINTETINYGVVYVGQSREIDITVQGFNISMLPQNLQTAFSLRKTTLAFTPKNSSIEQPDIIDVGVKHLRIRFRVPETPLGMPIKEAMKIRFEDLMLAENKYLVFKQKYQLQDGVSLLEQFYQNVSKQFPDVPEFECDVVRRIFEQQLLQDGSTERFSLRSVFNRLMLRAYEMDQNKTAFGLQDQLLSTFCEMFDMDSESMKMFIGPIGDTEDI